MAIAPENMKLCALRVEEVTVLFLVRAYKQKQAGMAQHICSKQLGDWGRTVATQRPTWFKEWEYVSKSKTECQKEMNYTKQ